MILLRDEAPLEASTVGVALRSRGGRGEVAAAAAAEVPPAAAAAAADDDEAGAPEPA
jgi:hypothetical protein